MTKRVRIAFTGNPNVGKTTLFNALTGSRQHVGNWPGVTVEKKTGRINRNGYDIEIVDLPGTYSLTAYSADEIVARDFILEEKPDVVVQVVDATNLERNLYLTTQLAELGAERRSCVTLAAPGLGQGRAIMLFSREQAVTTSLTCGGEGGGAGSPHPSGWGRALRRPSSLSPCMDRVYHIPGSFFYCLCLFPTSIEHTPMQREKRGCMKHLIPVGGSTTSSWKNAPLRARTEPP